MTPLGWIVSFGGRDDRTVRRRVHAAGPIAHFAANVEGDPRLHGVEHHERVTIGRAADERSPGRRVQTPPLRPSARPTWFHPGLVAAEVVAERRLIRAPSGRPVARRVSEYRDRDQAPHVSSTAGSSARTPWHRWRSAASVERLVTRRDQRLCPSR